jgi:hypothetical protein
VSDKEEQKGDAKDFWNDSKITNRWNPAFNDAMQSLNASYFNGNVDFIKGEIKNYTNKTWQYVELTFALYNEKGELIDKAYARIAKSIKPGDIVRFKTGNGGLYHLKAKRYKIISISPM